jgi:hypothetical protein
VGVLFTIGHATASVLLLMAAPEGILGMPANGVRLAVLFPTSAVLLVLNFVIQWHPLLGFLMSPLPILINSPVWGFAVAYSISRLRRGRPEGTPDSASE